MWFGYLTYPNTFLTSTDQAILDQSAFISATKLPNKVPACESIGGAATALEANQRSLMSFDRALMRRACAYRTLLAAKALDLVPVRDHARTMSPAIASSHIERPAYWPDPAPDCSVKPCTRCRRSSGSR